MGFGTVVADVSRSTQRGSRTTAGSGGYCSRAIRPEGTMQESSLEAISGKNKMVEILIGRADSLAFGAVNKGYKKRLVKAHQLFERFCR